MPDAADRLEDGLHGQAAAQALDSNNITDGGRSQTTTKRQRKKSTGTRYVDHGSEKPVAGRPYLQGNEYPATANTVSYNNTRANA